MQHAACVATGRVTRRAATKGLGHPTPLVCRTNSNGPPAARSLGSTLAGGVWFGGGGGDPTETRHLSGRQLQGGFPIPSYPPVAAAFLPAAGGHEVPP
jgi:hypothetical protein